LSLLIAILILVLVAAVVIVVGAPLRSARLRRESDRAGPGRGGVGDGAERGGAPERSASPARLAAGGELEAERRGELESEREAKYREIRDAELDYRTGKLSREDYETIDRELRAEAIEILNRLEPENG
jgi:hypothetical protein